MENCISQLKLIVTSSPFYYSSILGDLKGGMHDLIIQTNCEGWDIEIFGAWAKKLAYNSSSAPIEFRITNQLNISNISVEDKTYNSSTVPLNFCLINETTSQFSYSLDYQENVSILGNTTLTALSDGSHSLVVYANDECGNTGKSDIVFFTVDSTPPSIQVYSIENRTYNVTSLPLDFTLNESPSWIGYCLDGQINKTITDNSTIAQISEGAHSLTIYANDTAGNMGFSTIYFSTKIESISTTNLPLGWIPYAIIALVIVAITGVLVYFKKHKK